MRPVKKKSSIPVPRIGRRPPKRKNKVREWKPTFLSVLCTYGNIGRACDAAKISRTQVAVARHDDALFAAAFQEAMEIATDKLEAEARRRAVDGVNEGVYWQGQLVATELRYSDGLLQFLLRAHRPEKFREKFDVHIPSVDAAIEQLLARRVSQTAVERLEDHGETVEVRGETVEVPA